MFGEVYDADPTYLSTFTTEAKLQAVIDFGFQTRSIDFAKGDPTTSMRDCYAQDDYYTDTDSNAYQLPTFTGNHDMGRASMMLARGRNPVGVPRRAQGRRRQYRGSEFLRRGRRAQDWCGRSRPGGAGRAARRGVGAR
ncbi:hypothetical protein BH23ACT6_BH23ACT6_08900 [soil metagenome]